MSDFKTLLNQYNAGLITCLEVVKGIELLNMGSDTTTLTFRVVQGIGFGYSNGQVINPSANQ